jgi:2-polyprenyl-3-methyl-5-hydroxy-6-metoxy-1,4-benzoquinol methylase
VESAELVAILREVRERVRARYPENMAGPAGPVLPDLMPLVQARDVALGKVASIGTVNPRRGGPVNSLVQAGKRLIARMLDWHVREQVEFNRKMVGCVESTIEALTEVNRALAELGGQTNRALVELEAHAKQILGLCDDFQDIRNHWAQWRQGWEHKLGVNEIQFLRSVADLQGAFEHRTTLMDAGYRDLVRTQHADFTAALDRWSVEIQKRLWADLERVRLEYDRIVSAELRIIRQRLQIAAAGLPAAPQAAQWDRPPGLPSADQPPPAAPLAFDYTRFAERFRGTEEHVKATQQIYNPYFAGLQNVLDVGCGRGEFLQSMREAGVAARGIDMSPESVALCRQKGLSAEVADLFAYLNGLPEGDLDGIFCSQVVEHLPPLRLPELLQLAVSRLARGGVIAIETPNPECLAIFATYFYLDPTHTRPIPHPLLVFYLQEFGVGNIEVKRLAPAVESMPSLAALPEDFRAAFFGGLDYAVIGKKL